MPKEYILKAPDLKDLKEPCITGTIPNLEKKIIFDAKIHIPYNYFEEEGTYAVIPTSPNGGLFHPTYHRLCNNSSFDISKDVASGIKSIPHYLHMEDRVQLFNNQVKGKKVLNWDVFDYDKPPAGFLLLDKKVKGMLLMNDDLILVSDEPEVEKYVEKSVLKTKPVDMRKLGRKIIPVIRSSC